MSCNLRVRDKAIRDRFQRTLGSLKGLKRSGETSKDILSVGTLKMPRLP